MEGYTSNLQNLMDYTALITRMNTVRTAPELDVEQVRADARAQMERIEAREAATAADVPLTLPWLCSALRLTRQERFLVITALAFELDGGLRLAHEKAFGTPVPDLHYGFLLLDLIESLGDEIFACTLPESALCRYLLRDWRGAGHLMTRPLLLIETAARFLTCQSVGESLFYSLVYPDADSLIALYPAEEARLFRFFSEDEPGRSKLALLSGRAGSGRKSLALRAAQQLRLACLYFKTARLAALDAESLRAALRDAVCAAALAHAVVCIDDFCAKREDLAGVLLEALAGASRRVVLLCGGEEAAPTAPGYTVERFCLPDAPGYEESEVAWRFFAPRAGRFAFDPASFAGRYRFSPENIRLVTESAARRARLEDRPAEARDLARAISDQSVSGDFEIDRDPHFTLDDLVLPPEAREQLELACLFVERQTELWDRWKFGERFSYGRNVAILMHGESGTGKTMAAGAVAARLRMPLLKADLSRIMDKYIGETEKRLDSVFSAARQNGCALLFDEADSLFGRRTDVESSHDKYANLSTSYLLQRLEQYDGVVLLSTNLIRNFDNAFLRRIRFVIKFPMPDKELREALWRRAFPRGEMLSQDADFALLAQAELSPARIQSAALAAALYAMRDLREEPHGAAPRDPIVTMRHLAAALRLELAKTGKIVPAGLQKCLALPDK